MKPLINRINSVLLSDKKFANKVKYNKQGYYIHRQNKNKNFHVTVIMPVFNSEETMTRAIDSVIDQTLGFENIELLIIDDQSEDKSRAISLSYSKKYHNINPIFLKENSGSPSTPRNLGIKLAKGDYIMFLDSDDWLDENGVKSLYDLLEKTGNNYAVGKTIKKTDKGQYIIGEYNSWATRESINPFSIGAIFHHLAPTGRMMKTDFLREHHIIFPDMPFAEDKQFFFDVLTNCDFISTSDEVIYYANRYKDNESFTKTTSIFEKTDTNIALIKYVISKKLPQHIEKMMLSRLYEFDCITRLFNREHFLKSKKKENYYRKFEEVMATADRLPYDFKDVINEPWHKTLVDLFLKARYDDIITLIKWSRKEQTKDYFIEDNIPYYKLPFIDQYSKARIRTIAVHHSSIRNDDNLTVQFNMYGDDVDKTEALVLRRRHDDLNEMEFDTYRITNNLFEAKIPYQKLEKLAKVSYAIFIKYDGYKKSAIRMNARNIVNYKKRKFDFYVTVGDNFGINID
ncbi:hypothetical protein GCM10007063_24900 [Lentibacillus kapialis]|uniref:Glycosyltransferase 2-like domain-containing protein n=1 Tax=Lentibacillus kapialis TaxID=340214 RepID=A0A917PZL0_9BACI|nr:glycosyltransferase family 2 protein [Lentibacillus kapialis]GGK01610.1 hypothetical protein GCM10007063_24900 [Lentibacillus kapialis]